MHMKALGGSYAWAFWPRVLRFRGRRRIRKLSAADAAAHHWQVLCDWVAEWVATTLRFAEVHFCQPLAKGVCCSVDQRDHRCNASDYPSLKLCNEQLRTLAEWRYPSGLLRQQTPWQWLAEVNPPPKPESCSHPFCHLNRKQLANDGGLHLLLKAVRIRRRPRT